MNSTIIRVFIQGRLAKAGANNHITNQNISLHNTLNFIVIITTIHTINPMRSAHSRKTEEKNNAVSTLPENQRVNLGPYMCRCRVKCDWATIALILLESQWILKGSSGLFGTHGLFMVRATHDTMFQHEILGRKWFDFFNCSLCCKTSIFWNTRFMRYWT